MFLFAQFQKPLKDSKFQLAAISTHRLVGSVNSLFFFWRAVWHAGSGNQLQFFCDAPHFHLSLFLLSFPFFLSASSSSSFRRVIKSSCPRIEMMDGAKKEDLRMGLKGEERKGGGVAKEGERIKWMQIVNLLNRKLLMFRSSLLARRTIYTQKSCLRRTRGRNCPTAPHFRYGSNEENFFLEKDAELTRKCNFLWEGMCRRKNIQVFCVVRGSPLQPRPRRHEKIELAPLMFSSFLPRRA